MLTGCEERPNDIRSPIPKHRSPGLIRVVPVITGDLKSKIDRLWASFWLRAISNPLEVIDKVNYLLLIHRLDDLQIVADKKVRFKNGVMEDAVSLTGQSRLRWPDELTKNGMMTSGRLLEWPYTDHAPTCPDSFFPHAQFEGIVNTLHHIKQTAVPEEIA